MAGGYTVESDELLAHAQALETLAERFEAVKEASTHIMLDFEAYGTGNGWMALLMANRHLTQNQLVAAVAGNLAAAAGELRAVAAAYDDTDKAAQQEMQGLLADLEG